MSFKRFFLVRLGWALLGLWFVATLVFVLFYVYVDDPARSICGGERASQACLETVRKDLHLGASLPEQYAAFLWRLVVRQSAGYDSGEIARQAMPATLSLVVPALLLAAGIGLAAGAALARVRRRRILDMPIYVAFGLTPLVLGLFLEYYFGYRWDLVPFSGYCDFFNPSTPIDPLAEQCGGAVDWATHLLIPVTTFSLYFAAIYTRVAGAFVVDVRSAKEAEERRRRRRRSALVFARFVGRDFGFAVGFAVFAESLFTIPGLGYSVYVSAIAESPLYTQAYVLYATLLAVAVHFVVDVLVGALDPDLRWERPVARKPKPA